MTSASLAESISIFYPLPRLDFRAKWGPNSDKNSVSRKRQRLCARNGNRPLHRCHFPLKHYYITNSDFPQGLSCFSSVPHARKYPAGRRNYSERSFGTTLNSKEEENALQDRGPPESGDPGGASLHRRNIMEGRCQYTVFFSAALNLQNIQITDKKLSPISPSFNPCGPCGPQRLPVLHHRGPRRISILAVLADCDKDWQGVFLDTDSISILAVLADRDGIAYLAAADHGEISILAVLADRDAMRSMRSSLVVIFQSSRSLRTATPIFP